jgi:hypothetical protein
LFRRHFFKIMRNIFFLLFFTLCFLGGNTQNKILYPAKVVAGDTIILINLEPVVILSPKTFHTESEKKKYNKLVYNVKKVYPYAKLAGEKMRQYDKILREAKNDRERKKIMKKAEDELRAEFEVKLRAFTFSQGRILIKLIDRETSQTSYDLLSDLRGTISAVLWQGVGRLFGYNLKAQYDPKDEDKEIEEIVRLIEVGAI